MYMSIVTPAYKCSDCIEELYKRLVHTLYNMGIDDYEIIFVNDGSPENDWDVICQICQKDTKVKGINLSRNFGQHKAISAGLDHVSGEWVVVMDCDLQDQPEEIPKLYAKALEGFDVVFGKRFNRQDSRIKKILSKGFNIIFSYLLEQKIDNTVANFCIIHKKVINNIKQMKENTRSHALFIYWLGYDAAYLDIEHSQRFAGSSAYTFNKALNLAIDFAISQSNKPLKIFIKFGFAISSISFIYGINLIVKYFVYKIPVPGWTSIMVSLYFIAGLILASMGLLGIYIGKIFDEVKGRPLYAIKEQVNIHPELRPLISNSADNKSPSGKGMIAIDQ